MPWRLSRSTLGAALSIGLTTSCTAEGLSSTNMVVLPGLTNRIEVVLIEGGEFLMGCPSERPEPWKSFRFDPESPEHKVYVSPFWMGKYPITVAQFCEYLNESRETPSQEVFKKFKHIELKNGDYQPVASKGLHPVVGVSFKEAQEYCAWLSKLTDRTCRLPTEAEWEFAAKGGTNNRTYPWGEEVKETSPNPVGKAVDRHPELGTPEGIFDLNGPVCQWCIDFFDAQFYSASPHNNPICTRDTGRRVVRGGPMFRVFVKSVFDERLFLPPSWKRYQSKESGDTTIGFRIVVER